MSFARSASMSGLAGLLAAVGCSGLIGLGDVEEAFHKMERGEVLRSVVLLN